MGNMMNLSIVVILMLGIVWAANGDANTFKVGVLDMASFQSWNVTNRDQAMEVMQKNLNTMDNFARIASKEGVKMMVFPEYSLQGFMDGPGVKRDLIYPFMETLSNWPYPVNGTCPLDCSKQMVQELAHIGVACIAQKYGIYIIANMIDRRPCEILQDHHCPADNNYLYNANAVFNPNGCLIAKYHKTHLVEDEPFMLDAPRHPEIVYFDTEYGRFGTIICADGLYKEPLIELVEKNNIDHLIYPMSWQNDITQPYLRPNAWQLAIAARFNISVIAANMHDVNEFYMGSGIYRSTQVFNYTYNTQPRLSTLVTAQLPIIKSQQHNPNPPIKPHPAQIKADLHRIEKATPPSDGTVTLLGDVYNAKALNGTSGTTSVCQNGFCCTLQYTRNSTADFIVLAAFRGKHTFETEAAMENCVVYKCAQDNFKSCSTSQETSKTSFSRFHLDATFSMNYVYPSLLPSGLAYDKLNWKFNRPNFLQNSITVSSDWPLVAVSLIGIDD